MASSTIRFGLAAACLLSACAASTTTPPAASVTAAPASSPQGYLSTATYPDSLLLNPPPPPAGSAAFARDEEVARAALAQRGSARWNQAIADADIRGANPLGLFSCAANLSFGPASTPKTVALLRKLTPDLGYTTLPSKRRYLRPRPFMLNGQPICTPQDEAALRTDGSYPSGHSAIGYGWGLVLAELVPDRAAQLIARGRDFGISRTICNVHWLSDIEEGRVIAGAVVARVHAEPAFEADLEAAKAELRALPAALPKPDCTPGA